MSASDHLRLRGGGPSKRSKPDSAQQQGSPAKRSARGTASPSPLQQDADKKMGDTEEKKQLPKAQHPHEYKTGDVVEVIIVCFVNRCCIQKAYALMAKELHVVRLHDASSDCAVMLNLIPILTD